MLAISCLSQKGGVGKSTLTRMIATTYATAKWRVKIADFNVKQKTSVDWAAMRMEANLAPLVPAEPFSHVKQIRVQAHNYDLIVFDGRPDSDTSTLEIARESDLIVVPAGVTLDDLQPQVRFAHELRARGIDRSTVLFVINKSIESQLAVEDAKEFVRAAGYLVAETDLPMKTGYQIAQNTGRTVTETTFPSLNKRAETLAQEIVSKMQEIAER